MPIEPMEPSEYEKETAAVTSTIIRRSIEIAYPKFSPKRREDMIIGVIDRLAHMHGWAIRRIYVRAEDDGE
jgi:hypothetical protein